MARKITIVSGEDLGPEEYAARGNGIWGVLKIAPTGGGFHLESDGGTPDGFLNDWWARHGGRPSKPERHPRS
jgi:hypothetical protein